MSGVTGGVSVLESIRIAEDAPVSERSGCLPRLMFVVQCGRPYPSIVTQEPHHAQSQLTRAAGQWAVGSGQWAQIVSEARSERRQDSKYNQHECNCMLCYATPASVIHSRLSTPLGHSHTAALHCRRHHSAHCSCHTTPQSTLTHHTHMAAHVQHYQQICPLDHQRPLAH